MAILFLSWFRTSEYRDYRAPVLPASNQVHLLVEKDALVMFECKDAPGDQQRHRQVRKSRHLLTVILVWLLGTWLSPGAHLLAESEPSPVSRTELQERWQELRQLLSMLPEDEREAFWEQMRRDLSLSVSPEPTPATPQSDRSRLGVAPVALLDHRRADGLPAFR